MQHVSMWKCLTGRLISGHQPTGDTMPEMSGIINVSVYLMRFISVHINTNSNNTWFRCVNTLY